MPTLSAHRRNGLGLLFLLSALAHSAAGCGDEPAQRTSPGDEAHEEISNGGAGDDADAAPATISVHGKVLDLGRRPLAGVPVLIGDHPLALTDTSGEFTVPHVSAPYTVTVLLSPSKTVVIYEGLSRPDPTIMAADSSTQLRQAGIQGTLAGGTGYPEAALTRTSVQLAAALYSSTPGFSQPGENTFILPPPSTLWTGQATVHGTLHALQYTHAAANDFKPIDYKGYGTLPNVSLTEGENEIPAPIALGPIGKVSFAASATAPADYAIKHKRLRLTIGGQVAMELPKETLPGPDIQYPLPAIDGAKVQVRVSADNAATGAVSTTTKNALALDTANATIGILPAPTLVLPVDKATGANMSTPFSWTKLDGGIHVLVLFAGADEPRYQIFTAATEARLPDLASAGIQLPPGTTYQWGVVAFAPFASVDAYAGKDVGDENALPVLYEAQSSIRSFTTAP